MSISVLIPHNIEDYSNKNAYLENLVNAYKYNGIDVHCSLQDFFYSDKKYDVIHIHWPEHIRWIDRNIEPKHCFNRFINRLSDLSKKTLCLWTVHNTYPHRHAHSQTYHNLYQETIDHMDGLIHHCFDSYQIIRRYYNVRKGISEITIPHGNYGASYNTYSRIDCRKHLNLPLHETIILFVGQLDKYKGPDFVLKAFRIMKESKPKPKSNLIVCGWIGNIDYSGELMGIFRHRKWVLAEGYKFLFNYPKGVRLFLGKKSEKELDMFLRASDVLVLGHKHILTSGVAALSASYGKVVVAPKMGCIPEQLAPEARILYQPNNAKDCADSMKLAIDVDSSIARNAQLKLSSRWDWNENMKILINWIMKLKNAKQKSLISNKYNV